MIDLAEMMKKPEYQEIAQQELFVQCLFGTQAYTEDTHYTTFTERLLRHYLAKARLEVSQWGLLDGWLFEVDAVKVPHVPETRPPAPPQQAPQAPLLSEIRRRLVRRSG